MFLFCSDTNIRRLFVLLLLSSTITVVLSQCSICGEGMSVTAKDGIFTFPGQPTMPCGVLQTAGCTGVIPIDQCPSYPLLIGMCDCQIGEACPIDEDEDEESSFSISNIIRETPTRSILKILSSDQERFSQFIFAATATNLISTLESDGPLTVFAPQDDGFDTSTVIDEDVMECLLLTENLPTLRDIVLYHVYTGQSVMTDSLFGTMVPEMSNEEIVTIRKTTKRITVNTDAMIVDPNITASNGVIHVIDSVLIPDFFSSTTCGNLTKNSVGPTPAPTPFIVTIPPSGKGGKGGKGGSSKKGSKKHSRSSRKQYHQSNDAPNRKRG